MKTMGQPSLHLLRMLWIKGISWWPRGPYEESPYLKSLGVHHSGGWLLSKYTAKYTAVEAKRLYWVIVIKSGNYAEAPLVEWSSELFTQCMYLINFSKPVLEKWQQKQGSTTVDKYIYRMPSSPTSIPLSHTNMPEEKKLRQERKRRKKRKGEWGSHLRKRIQSTFLPQVPPCQYWWEEKN